MSFNLTLSRNHPNQPTAAGTIGADPRDVAECMADNRDRLMAVIAIVQSALTPPAPKPKKTP